MVLISVVNNKYSVFHDSIMVATFNTLTQAQDFIADYRSAL